MGCQRRKELATAIAEGGLASGCLIGTYGRDNSVKNRTDEVAALGGAAKHEIA